MGNLTKKIQETAGVLNMLLVIGFLGIVWLMIYGNLSGNLGFSQTSSSFNNETINMTGGATPAGAQSRVDGSLSNIVMTNATGGEAIPSTNYTVSGVAITNTTSENADNNVNVSYTVTYDSANDVNAETVISNLTTGVTTFFGFSNIFFTITAIVLLITILLGLLAVVLSILKATKGGGGRFAE